MHRCWRVDRAWRPLEQYLIVGPNISFKFVLIPKPHPWVVTYAHPCPPIAWHVPTHAHHAHPWTIISHPCPPKTHGHGWAWVWVWAPNVGLCLIVHHNPMKVSINCQWKSSMTIWYDFSMKQNTTYLHRLRMTRHHNPQPNMGAHATFMTWACFLHIPKTCATKQFTPHALSAYYGTHYLTAKGFLYLLN